MQAAGNVALDPSRSVTIGSGFTATFDTNGYSMTIPATIGGVSGSLLKAGTGTLTLSGANGFGGATTVNGGTLAHSPTSALGSSTKVTINNSGTLQLNVPDGRAPPPVAINPGGTIDLNGQTVTTTATITPAMGGLLTNTSARYRHLQREHRARRWARNSQQRSQRRRQQRRHYPERPMLWKQQHRHRHDQNRLGHRDPRRRRGR